jgi:hypothetical protein
MDQTTKHLFLAFLLGVVSGSFGASIGANTATVVFLTAASKATGAVCIDGTPPAYYFRQGTGSGAKKWYIHHEGGGWCESVPDCYGRSKTDLGSSANYKATMDLGGGYFSNDPAANPMMYNWNVAYLKYCDGGSFSGNNETATVYQGNNLYFRGFRNLKAIFEDLSSNHGLNVATDVVVSGCSAGGLATYLHVDWWRERLPQKAHVVGMPDSGFFLDYESASHYHTGMIWVFNTMNATDGVNQDCIKGHPSDPWKCFFAEHTCPFIKTPTFPLQPEYDSWQIDNDLNSHDPVKINQYGAILTTLMKLNLLNRPQHGVFLDSCEHHCGGWGSIKIDGENQAQAFQNFYEGRKKVYIQGKDYPCTPCCQ